MTDIISHIPDLLIYFIPGYISFSFAIAVLNRRPSETTKIAASCCMSYLTLSLLRCFFAFKNVYAEILLSGLVCFAFTCMILLIIQRPLMRSILSNLFAYSPAKGAWEDAYDIDNGSRIRIKIKNSDLLVVGDFCMLGNIESDPWLSITYYHFYNGLDATEPYYSEVNGDYYFLVNLNDIEFVEMWSNTN